jgi:putative oxidoreductase
MNLFHSPSSNSTSLGLAVLRIAAAIVFIHHGYQKVFGMGFTGISGAFGHMGVPLPGVMGPLIAILEFFGGIALLLGFLTRPLGFFYACDMLGAIFLVKLKDGFGKSELEFLLFAAGVTLLLTGAGAYSVDAMIARRSGAATTAP